MFKVGDRVKIKSTKSNFDNVLGTVKEVQDDLMFRNLVEFDVVVRVYGIPYKKMVFCDDELELIGEGS